jgi:hypothetical protein
MRNNLNKAMAFGSIALGTIAGSFMRVPGKREWKISRRRLKEKS